MEELENKKDKSVDWFLVIMYVIPYMFIGTYFLGWFTLFRISAIVILLGLIWSVYEQFKEGSKIVGIFHSIMILIFMEIGYLLMEDVLDGICMGMYVGIIASQIETLMKYVYKKIKS